MDDSKTPTDGHMTRDDMIVAAADRQISELRAKRAAAMKRKRARDARERRAAERRERQEHEAQQLAFAERVDASVIVLDDGRTYGAREWVEAHLRPRPVPGQGGAAGRAGE